jgi:hypothetical protein
MMCGTPVPAGQPQTIHEEEKRPDMSGDTVSADPDKLLAYEQYGTNVAEPGLLGQAKALDAALSRLAHSATDPTVMPYVPDLGVQSIAYTHRQGALDLWVGEVGRAFQKAGGSRQLVHTASGDVWVVVTTTDVLDPQILQQEQADARAMADKLKNEAQNGQSMADDLAQLQADSVANPEFAANVFNDLGPGMTLVIASQLEDKPGQLQALDESLAQASNFWQKTGDNSFVNGLFDGKMPGYLTDMFRWAHVSDLFKYGVYAKNFLETAADKFFFSTHNPLDFNGYTTMMQALDRNAPVARDWLMGQQDWMGQKGSRMTLLLSGGPPNQMYGDWSGALGQTIFDAGQTITDTGMREHYFQDMAVDYRLVPDGARAGMAKFLGAHIGDPYFLTLDPQHALDGHGYSWQYRVLMSAELGADGRVVPDNVSAVQQGIHSWMDANQGLLHSNPGQFLRDVGQLTGLSTEPLRYSIHALYQDQRDQREYVRWMLGTSIGAGLILFAPEEIAVGSVAVAGTQMEMLKFGLDKTADSVLKSLISNDGITIADANLNEQQLWQTTDAGQRAGLVDYMYQNDPNFLPPSLHNVGGQPVQDYLNWIAGAKPDDTPPANWPPDMQSAATQAAQQLDHFEATFNGQQAVPVEGQSPSPDGG